MRDNCVYLRVKVYYYQNQFLLQFHLVLGGVA